jgi:hypothetical protein
VPTAADDVFFDANSNTGTGAFTVTMATSPRVCRNLTISGLDGTMTLAGAGIGLTVSGSLTFPVTNFNRTYSGTTIFNATTTGNTITTNGVSFGNEVQFNGAGGGWTLGSALTTSSSINLVRGTLDTSSVGNYAINAQSLISTSGVTRGLNLNGSTVTLSLTVNSISFFAVVSFTFNAGTSQINLAVNTSFDILLGGLTYYNVSFTAVNYQTISITGANTFNNLTFTGRTTAGISEVAFGANQTINGTLTLGAGASSVYRTFLRSGTIGTARTLTVSALAAGAADIDFRDIAVTGSAAPLTGTRFGDCKGNSGITFPAAKTVYWGTTSTNWATLGNGAWSLTNGGPRQADAFPLAQDTAVFPSDYPDNGGSATISSNYNIGAIDMSARTSNTMTLAIGSLLPTIYGNWINGTGTTITSSGGSINFAGRQTQTITTAEKSFSSVNITIFNVNTTVRIVGNLTAGTLLTLNDSTLNLNGYTASCSSFEANGPSNLTFNGGTLSCRNVFSATGTLTTTSGTAPGIIALTNPNAGASQSFLGGSNTYNCTLQLSSVSSTINIGGSNTFTTIINTEAISGLYFEYNTTNTFTNWNVNGTAGNLVTLDSSDGEASFSISKASGIVSSDYLNIKHSDAIGGAAWYAGTHSIKDGATSGWILTAPPAVASTGNFLLFF